MIIRMLISLTFVLRHSAQQSQTIKDVCGIRRTKACPAKVNLRVTNGASSCAERVPWNVLVENTNLGVTAPDGGVYPYCGGVLITERHVLSAAHCYWSNMNQFGICPRQFENSTAQICRSQTCPSSCTRVDPEELLLHLGLTNRLKPETGEFRGVQSIDIHPGWDRGDRLNDILDGHDLALLTMKSRVNIFGDKIIPICLPINTGNPTVGSAALVSGFGVLINPRDGSKSHPTVLQTATVNINSRSSCAEKWDIKGSQICAVGNSPSSSVLTTARLADSCNGDSGGGLTTTEPDGRVTLVGIISFGEPECGRLGGKPGVYTNVQDHLNWIQKRINDQDSGISPGSKICISDNGKRCKFPFKYNGKVFASCTTEFDKDNEPWCSTRTDSEGNHIIGEEEWGHCPSSCPVNILTTPPGPSGSGSGTIPTPVASWGTWSSCSTTCGKGTRERTNDLCPRTASNCIARQIETCFQNACTSPFISSEWTDWSACSATCGDGRQTRTQRGSQVAQQRGCNLGSCPTSGVTNQDDFQSLWIVGGAEEHGYIESFTPLPGGSFKSETVAKLPIQRDSTIGGTVGGRIYICGGSSGSFGNSVVHNDCFTKLTKYKDQRWEYAPSMPLNTTHAASTVLKRKIYVFGGYMKPVCGYKPKVQVFDHDRQKWSASPSMDPPLQFGGYGCAAAYDSKIFVTGGYFTEDVYTTECKEKETDDELTVSNRKIENYLDYVQFFNTRNGIWSQAPRMQYARRNHGCAIVTYKGRKGLLVAGGYNSKDFFLKSVEFLPLQNRMGTAWNQLTSLDHYRGSRLGVLPTRRLIYVVSGDLDGNGTLVEVLPVSGGSWRTLRKRLLEEKSFSTFVTV